MCPIWELSHQTMQRGAGPKDSGTGVSGTQDLKPEGLRRGVGPTALPSCPGVSRESTDYSSEGPWAR